MLPETGVPQPLITDGDRNDGIVLRFRDDNYRIDFRQLVGESVWLYPQTEVFIDLAARRKGDGGTCVSASAARPSM
jgi:p-hydroxybenzoate 3-monooxygenase